MKFERSDFSSLLAVLISLGALTVSLYEARLMQKQQAILQEQQKASVWPYVESENLFVLDADQIKISFSLVNKGVGPARLSKSKMVVFGKEIVSYDDVSAVFLEILEDFDPKFNISHVSVNFGEIQGILSPLEKYTYLEVTLPGLSEFPDGYKISEKLEGSHTVLCYCSIYDDCWTLKTEPDSLTEGCTIE